MTAASLPFLPAMDAMHMVARRYCLNRPRLLHERGHGETAGAGRARLDLSARYDVLYAILTDIEGLTPEDAVSSEEMRQLLIVAGQTAWGFFMPHQSKAAEVQAMDEERALFCDYVTSLSPEDLRRVQPLPYHRTLSRTEHERLWAQLQDRWGTIHGYWYPLTGEPPPPDVVAVQADWFYHAVPLDTLRGILRDQGIARVWELREFGPEYEMDIALLEPEYIGAEGYWTSPGMGWLVYASHESSLTLASDCLRGVEYLAKSMYVGIPRRAGRRGDRRGRRRWAGVRGDRPHFREDVEISDSGDNGRHERAEAGVDCYQHMLHGRALPVALGRHIPPIV